MEGEVLTPDKREVLTAHGIHPIRHPPRELLVVLTPERVDEVLTAYLENMGEVLGEVLHVHWREKSSGAGRNS